jgi:uncharacterized membrane protein YphA (DoxX/SURF4 family)
MSAHAAVAPVGLESNSRFPRNRWLFWTGWALSVLPALALVMSAAMKLSGSTQATEMFSGKYGYPASALAVIGILELGCTLLYLVPRTAVLGAILLTGYLGGAVATHVRVSEAPTAAAILGVLVWAGLFLRDSRIRALIPLRTPTNSLADPNARPRHA